MLQCLASHDLISMSKYGMFMAVLFPILLASAFQGCSCDGKQRLSGDGSEDAIEPEEGYEPLADTDGFDALEELGVDISEPDPEDVPAEELEPPVYWSRLYETDSLWAVADASPDGGCLLIGKPLRNLVMKLDPLGGIEWRKVYEDELGNTMDGIFRFGMESFLTIGDITTHYGSDIWLMELDMTGEILRQKAYRGLGAEHARTVLPTGDGGWIMSGSTTSFGAGDGDWDGLVIRLDSAWNILWQYCYRGEYSDDLYFMKAATEGGFVLVGESTSFSEGGSDIWIVRIDDEGGIVWQKGYGGPGGENVISLDAATAGGYVVSGHSNSFGEGPVDFWIFRIDGNGGIVWQKSLGTPDIEEEAASRSTSDGGVIVAGSSQAYVPGRGILVKLDENGNIEWQKFYGSGDFVYRAIGVEQTADGGFFVWGSAFSNTEGERVWLMKVDEMGEISPDCPPGFVTEASLVAADTGAVPYDTEAVRTTTSLWVIDTDAVAGECEAIDVETTCESG